MTFDAEVTTVAEGTLQVPARRTGIAVDIGIRGRVGNRPGLLLSVGTACWAEVMDVGHAISRRLRRSGFQPRTARG
ncbi:hypothetical protein PV364_36290 [Streptomyces sp. MI02-7b]|nr:hypothetical protein [Streptomyces sp. MI02-7b]